MKIRGATWLQQTLKQGDKEAVYCGECDYCDETKTKNLYNESPGALFCRLKRYDYGKLLGLRIISIEKYILTTGVILHGLHRTETGHQSLVQSPRKKTTIEVPLFLIEVLTSLSTCHNEESYDNEHFLDIIKNVNVKNVRINKIIDILTSPVAPKSIDKLVETFNAFQHFTLLMTFLNRLPSPIWKMSPSFCNLLFSEGLNQLPFTEEEMGENERRLIEVAINADFAHAKETTCKNLDTLIHEMFSLNRIQMSREAQAHHRKLFFHALRKDIVGLRPRIRRNILQIILRCLKFEVLRYTHKIFCSRRTYDEIRDELIMKKIAVEQYTNLSKCCAPVMVKLPGKMDSRENRVRALILVLWNMESQYLYSFEKEEFNKKVTCHHNCPCGYGELSEDFAKSISEVKSTKKVVHFMSGRISKL